MTAALIIAAGRTARKDAMEPGREVGTITAVQRTAMVFRQAGIERIVVVCGDGDRTEKLVSHMNLVFLRVPGGAEMLDGVKLGLAYLRDKCTAALITHVDVPLFSIGTVHALMAAGGGVCVPSYHGHGGHPILLRAEHFPAILSYTGEGGLVGAVRAAGLERRMVDVTDQGVLTNTHGMAPCTRLVEDHDLSRLRPAYQFQLMRERIFYNAETHHLLQLTEESGSLLDACRHMGISYTKGRALIANLEQQLGCPVLESQQGGKTGGSSAITGEARRLMHSYEAFCAEAVETLDALFQKHFTP